MDEDSEVNITYETLFELLRREKNREELQTLDQKFFNNVVAYLKEKKAMIDKKDQGLSEFSTEAGLPEKEQHENIKKIIKDLYDKREKKIINLAIEKTKTGSVDTEHLLEEEKIMFERLFNVLDNTRKSVLHKVLMMEKPSVEVKCLSSEEKEEEKQEEQKEEPGKKKVIFLEQTPKFVGKDLEVYGPYEPDDVAELTEDIANILIQNNKAQEDIE